MTETAKSSAKVAEAPSVRDYDDLPTLPGLGMPHAWDELDPALGSLSLIDPACRVRAAATVELGESFGLNLPLELIDPPLFGRSRLRHEIHEEGRNTLEDILSQFNPQSSSQWDGLLHVRAREFGFFGGMSDADVRSADLGIHRWAGAGIVGRAVLLDIPRWAAATDRDWSPLAGQALSASDLMKCADHQGVIVDTGDILCVRTGWIAAYRNLTIEQRSDTQIVNRFSGLRANADMARFLWNARVGALCADNPAVEVAPGDPADGSLHRRLIPLLGTCVAELLDFDRVAARCAEVSRWSFMFAAVPLPLRGGVSSPSNAVAVL